VSQELFSSGLGLFILSSDFNMAADPVQVLIDVDFSHPRFARLCDLVLLHQTLDMTIGQLQVCYLRTVNLMEVGLLPVVQVETSLVNLAVSCSYYLAFVHLFVCSFRLFICSFVHRSYSRFRSICLL